MNVPAQRVDHAARIAIRRHIAADLGLGDHFKPGVAVLFPGRLVVRHLADLLVGKGRKEAAMAQVALDAVLLHALADDVAALKRHGPELGGLFRPVAARNRADVAAVTIDDLPAIAPRSAKADALAFEHDDGIALFSQRQRGGKAGEACADHANIGLMLPFERRANGLVIGRPGIPGGGVAGIVRSRNLCGHDYTVRI